jgi:hypothetical protein
LDLQTGGTDEMVAEPTLPFSTRLNAELIEHLPDLLLTVQAQLSGSPDYAAFLGANQPEVARLAGDTIRRLVESVQYRVIEAAGPDPVGGTGGTGGTEAGGGEVAPELLTVQTELFEVIGRIQCREGQELARLLSAYQIGAHAAWRYISTAALRLRLPLVVVTELAEALFSFVDALTAASARGYVQEQSESAGERERLREELAARLLSDRCDSTMITLASERAGWSMPSLTSLILIDPEDDVSLLVLGRLGSLTLATRWGDWMVVIWPDRPGMTSRSAKIGMLRGMRAVVSRPMPWERLAASVQVMAAAARLRQQGLLAEDVGSTAGGGPNSGIGLLFVEDHLDAVIVHRDPRPLQALRDQVLAPLQAAPPSSRERLVETLASWLRQMGDRRAMAAELHIHPQTVRYRLGQLRELFGDALDDPRTRTRFTIALLSGAAPTLSTDEAGSSVSRDA